MSSMNASKLYAWSVVAATSAIMAALLADPNFGEEGLAAVAFWIILLVAVDLLPVSLGYDSEVMMGIPILLAVALIFPPVTAMTIAGVGAVDLREFKRELPLFRALFNRAQLMLSVGVASALLTAYRADAADALFLDNPLLLEALGVIAAASTHVLVNLTLVSLAIHFDGEIPFKKAFRRMLPDPVAGFVVSYAILSGLGLVTAVAYSRMGAWAAAAILVPTIFARVSLIGARTQQELSERIRRQQHDLLQATEKVFQERENERKRIAEDIHDSSLQMLAAASYSCGNANEFLEEGHTEHATGALEAARGALEEAIKSLRESLVDLRRSSVEEGGLLETIHKFADQMSTVWGPKIVIEGAIRTEPPIPVALAAFQILQEGVVNAMKHGGDTAVLVKVSDDDGMVHIVVEDSGPGFDPGVDAGADHVGMRLMKERAARVGGHLELDTHLGRGTRLEAILPGGVAR
jgi:signal transduction histidine kinase